MSKVTIFFDESGKPEVYSAKGVNLVEAGTASKYLILAAVRTPNHLELLQQVTEFRLQLLNDPTLSGKFSPAYTLDSFHAQKDFHEVRERFYEFINTLDIKIDVLVVEKLKCFDTLRSRPNKLYAVMSGQLLKNITHGQEEVDVIFSRKDSKLKFRSELQGEVDRLRLEYLENHPGISKNFEIKYYHNPHYTHAGLQVADYIAYAVFQHFEKGNSKYLSIVINKIGKIQDLCNKRFYTRSNPPQLSA